ncbi:MAG: MATE family efflux transporter [Spirochaetaceae bacterium]|jgi:putative MATE family efflux protein|nr:MATE family efflux transporter [Spirochaetaceae bacterium]
MSDTNHHTARDPEDSRQSRPQGDAATRLGTEGIGRLLVRFSLPAISGMLVQALYNIVDRIFVGRGVNELALGGISLVMPLMTVSMAFAMLFGVGSANMISMRLGQGRRDEAQNALNHCFFIALFIGVVLAIVQLVFLDFFLSLLGSGMGPELVGYARNYYRVILYGMVFNQVGFGFSHCTRAQGFPAITMTGMFIGAGTNLILDPIFIFVCKWGVEGAAWATIISQAISSLFILHFAAGKKAVVRLQPRSFRPSPAMAVQIMAFGSAQFLLQFIMSAVMFINNKSMGWYGAAGLGIPNGADVAMSGLNIAGSLMMVIMMPVFGINQGAQPILGFNYGAKKFRRVIKAYCGAVGAATIICTAGFIVIQALPHVLVGIFAPNGSRALLEFAPKALRIQTLLLPLTGFQVMSANMFIVTGRPKISIFLTMLRQFLALIPCMLIFGRVWGLYGVVAAAPVADSFAVLLTGGMILFEMRKLRAVIRQQETAGAEPAAQ